MEPIGPRMLEMQLTLYEVFSAVLDDMFGVPIEALLMSTFFETDLDLDLVMAIAGPAVLM